MIGVEVREGVVLGEGVELIEEVLGDLAAALADELDYLEEVREVEQVGFLLIQEYSNNLWNLLLNQLIRHLIPDNKRQNGLNLVQIVQSEVLVLCQNMQNHKQFIFNDDWMELLVHT